MRITTHGDRSAGTKVRLSKYTKHYLFPLLKIILYNHPSYKYLLNFIYPPLFANTYRRKKRNVINYRNHVICESDYLRKITKEKHKYGRCFKGKHGVVD